jgi:glycosyltransferase involved in cell wall biosynthesis
MRLMGRKTRFLFVGSVVEHKNVIELVDLFIELEKRQKNYILYIAGHSDTRILEKINKKIKHHSSVKILGYVSEKKLINLYKKVDAVITLSRNEGFCLPIYEGLMFGKPFIASKGIASESVKNLGLEVDLNLAKEQKIDLIENFVTTLGQVTELVKLGKGEIQKEFSWIETYNTIIKKPKFEIIYIFVDHTMKIRQNSGIQTTVRQICKALQKKGITLRPLGLSSDNNLVVPTYSQLRNLEKFNGPNYLEFDLDFVPDAEELNGRILLIPELLLYLDLENINSLFTTIAKFKMKSIFIIFDLLPITRFWDYNKEIKERFNFLMIKIISNASSIFCISEFVLKEFIEIYKPNLKKSKTKCKRLTLGSIETESIDSTPNVGAIYDEITTFISDSDLTLFYPATYEPRKNHELLHKVIINLNLKTSSRIKLVCTGWDAHPEIYERLINEKNINIYYLKNVDNEVIKFMYKHADYTIYPSLAEGYGLPIIESLKFGTKVICSYNTSMVEIAEQFAPNVISIDTGEEKIFTTSLSSVIYKNNSIIKPDKLLSKVTLPTWDETASQICESLKS